MFINKYFNTISAYTHIYILDIFIHIYKYNKFVLYKNLTGRYEL